MARSSKTEQVMGLIGGKPKKEKANPLVGANTAPAVKTVPALRETVKKTNPKLKYTWDCSGKQIVNIVTMLINEELGTVMERFNVCDCDKCCKFITEVVAGALPSIFVRVRSKGGEAEVNAALNKYRTAVIKALTKAVLAVKKTPPHD